MARWHRYFSAVPSTARVNKHVHSEHSKDESGQGITSGKFNSFLPEVYSGAPNRVERYVAYDQMDADSEISRALNVLSDFSTQNFGIDDQPFTLVYKGSLTETEIKILKESLSQWCSLNEWQKRLWRTFRNTLKYGDQIYIRDPETFKLIWIDPNNVDKIIVNESKGKKIEQYVIRNLDFNLMSLVGSNMLVHDSYTFPTGVPRNANTGIGSGSINQGVHSTAGRNSRFLNDGDSAAVDGIHVVHLSLSEGLDGQWPFGTSILENIYKVYKQKDLLEDAIVIYRIVRAPERRVFYIDVGSLSGERAMRFVERVKNEIYQRRIPNRTGGGACFDMSTRVPLLDGRTLSILDLKNEYELGKINWAYSCDPTTGKMVPGPITWAGITRKDAEVIDIELDNGQIITCTPDHKFPVLGRGKIEAKDIIVGEDSLISFNTRLHSINEYKKNKIDDPQYHQVFDHGSKSWKFTHRVVANFFKKQNIQNEMTFNSDITGNKRVIHHKDFNKYNNSPSNLYYMNCYDHMQLHAYYAREFRNTLTEEQKLEIIAKGRRTMASKSQEELDAIVTKRLKTLSVRSEKEKINSHIKRSNAMKFRAKKLRETDINEYNKRIQQWHAANTQMDKPWPNQKITSDELLFKKICEVFDSLEKPTVSDMLTAINNNLELINHYSAINIPNDKKIVKFAHSTICYESFRKILRYHGFNSWKQFLKSRGRSIVNPSRKIKWDISMLQNIVNAVQKHNINTISDVVMYINSDENFMSLYKKLNFSTKGNNNPDKFTSNTLRVMLHDFGYAHWNDFKDKLALFNHKVVKITYRSDTMDVGTITIDGKEQYHTYHTFALESGVYTFNSAIDASYNPIGINEDFFLATNADGKGTKIENLAGGENLGQIDDLKYFNNKMIRGLGIPSSYLPTGADDGTTVYNDGKIGTAYVQEFAFTKYCQRLQNLISPVLDHEFKMFIKDRGIEIQSNLFDLQMWPPQSFGEYRQMQIDSERISVFSSIMGTAAAKYISQRFALMRYLGWTEEEVLENEMMWKQENASKVQQKTGQSPTDNNQLGLSAVGVRPEFNGGDFGAPPGGEQSPTQIPPEASTAQNAVSDEATNSATSGTGLEGF
jgi:hypothetical protein